MNAGVSPYRATAIGFLAIGLWSAIVAVVRGVSESFGVVGGAALLYSLASGLLLLCFGRSSWRAWRSMPRRYAWWGSALFVAYELCLSLSIGFAGSGREAIEVSMLNYLWPSFTLVASVLFLGQRSGWLLWPGLMLALVGAALVLGGAEGLDAQQMLLRVAANPLAYGLALGGAFIWAAYCVLTARLARGHNAIAGFFVLVAATLWLQYWLLPGPAGAVFDGAAWNARSLLFLLLAACSMGFGYAAWNVGILHGNITVLSVASYFIPVFSALLAARVLGQDLPWTFWRGAALVCLGSLLCWLATRGK